MFSRKQIATFSSALLAAVLLAAGAAPSSTAPPSTSAARPAPPSSPPAPLRFDDAITAARRTLLTLADAAHIPGMTVAVAYKGKIIWSEGFGQSDLEQSTFATPRSKFRVASIAKNFTGTAVAKLVEQGRLDLDAPITRYLHDVPPQWQAITTRELADHTSGIAHYTSPQDALETHHFDTTAEAMAKIAARPMAALPGEKEVYSSFAYTVLAAVIEGVTGMDYLTFMQQEIFQPLGMLDTMADQHAQIIPERTGFYSYDDSGRVVNAPFVDYSDRWAGSGFLSTAEDLARFGAAHCKPGFLQASTLQLLVTQAVLPDSSHTREGLGWGPRTDWEGRSELWGNGIQPGSTCGLLVYPEQDLVLALCTNIQHAPIDRPELQILALRFLDLIEGRVLPPPNPSWADQWNLACTQKDKQFEASMRLRVDGRSCSGSISLQPGTSLSIVDGLVRGDELWLIALYPTAGLLPVPLRAGADGLTLHGEIMRIGITFTATRAEAPPADGR